MTEETTPEEIRILARQAGLDLPEDYLQELLLAWRHVRAMAARIPKDPPMAAEPAHVFLPATFAREG
ncbi:hypothetical protein [Paracraurococcus lichenis]|uniref:DUF4089 domain-containing protein n=1 Tax=Paracraurococcus lichenis TaxID=3064888 RepID=A0ABT9EBE8_9PROT|nr:hypothetical protein [Paracraurococcus sp. LOR1-02]MDO9713429.1 hypothetical protein [Paracraurococcus sp. LOR1-02]